MRLKEYTSLPKSADVSFKMTHLPKFCVFQILKTSNKIFSLLTLSDGFSGFKAGGRGRGSPQCPPPELRSPKKPSIYRVNMKFQYFLCTKSL